MRKAVATLHSSGHYYSTTAMRGWSITATDNNIHNIHNKNKTL